MRCLRRDTQTVYVSLYEQRVELTDEIGRYTGEYNVCRSEPIDIECNVSAAIGNSQIEVFGQMLNYDKTVIIDDVNFDIDEHAVLWIENDTSKPYDYIIKRVAKTPNYIALAVSKVDISNG